MADQQWIRVREDADEIDIPHDATFLMMSTPQHHRRGQALFTGPKHCLKSRRAKVRQGENLRKSGVYKE